MTDPDSDRPPIERASKNEPTSDHSSTPAGSSTSDITPKAVPRTDDTPQGKPASEQGVPVYESGGSGRWLIPVGTFVVGLVLGAIILGVARSGDSDNAGTATGSAPAATTGAPVANTPVPGSTIVVPAECVQLADDSRAASALIGNAADAAQALDGSRLADIVRKMQSTQKQLDSQATACRSAATGVTVIVPSSTS